MAFAILGYETLRGRPAKLPRVTGARAPAVLGSIVPYDLPALLAKASRAKQEMHIASVVGVDAGATKTSAALAHGATIVSRAQGAGANPTVVGLEAAADVILALYSARRAVRRRPEDIAAIYIGAAGAGSPDVARDARGDRSHGIPVYRTFASATTSKSHCAPQIPMDPASSSSRGPARSHSRSTRVGERHRAGGFGYVLGDEGSAAWIGFRSHAFAQARLRRTRAR